MPIVLKSKTALIFSILFLLVWPALAQRRVNSTIDPIIIAKKHFIKADKPAPGFFEGALLGNGAMGVVVTTRPDAIAIRFGHNNVWDIRIAEQNRDKIGTFQSVFEKVNAIPSNLDHLSNDPWYAEYNRMSGENYSKAYPRPFPCGSLILGFDRRKMSLVGHQLDISNGKCRVELITKNKKTVFLEIFIDMLKDKLWMQLLDNEGMPSPNLFDRVKVMPDPSTPSSFPKYKVFENLSAGSIQFRQILPKKENYSKDEDAELGDRAFRLSFAVNQALTKVDRISWNGTVEKMGVLEAGLVNSDSFLACVSLEEGLNTKVTPLSEEIKVPSQANLNSTFKSNLNIWKEFWNKSSVKLSDPFLEAIWYRNLYFFNCATKPEATCPGLFANWSYNDIGTAWHGDYHMNYNTQQPFWITFSSNHLEKNLAYVSLVESLMPVAKSWAKEYYKLPGAYFPHSAFPVEMTMNPYPIPDWGWEVSETPWTVQGLWWHYTFSGDQIFLKKRAYGPIKAAVEFLVAYMNRTEASGKPRWKDEKFHIFPTVPPELYGLRPGFKFNYDGVADLSLTKFIFNAFKEAASVLGNVQEEKGLIQQIDKILMAFPEYPTAEALHLGKVFVSVPGEHATTVHNVPNALFAVFPGEDLGRDSGPEIWNVLQNTYHNQQNEGGNDLVFMNFQAARLGLLDIEAFKRQIRYSLLPNGTATDMVMQTGGRYNDVTSFNYMAGMGIWFENFALPAVINECLLQSQNGKITLFPNWPKDKDATFNSLRASGAFLVSAVQRNTKVEKIQILSEQGNDLHIILPWPKSIALIGKTRKQISMKEVSLKTVKDQQIVFIPLK